MYSAIISKITVSAHPNADRLAVGRCLGFKVVVSLGTQDEQLGIFFPCDGQLSDAYCVANNLYPVLDEAGNRIGGGFISPKSPRVRAQRFRGVDSEGLWMPLNSLSTFGDVTSLKEGDTLTNFNGSEICSKWLNAATLKAIGQRGKQEKASRKETRWLKMHPDTAQLKYKLDSIPVGSSVVITEKLHGTCLKFDSKVQMWNGSKKRISDIKVGDVVLGREADKPHQLNWVASTVKDVIRSKQGVSSWLKLRFKYSPTSQSFSTLTCTSDHLIWTDEKGYVPAGNLEPGTLCTSTVRSPFVDEKSIEILTGMFLGGARIYHTDLGWGLSIGASNKYPEYLTTAQNVLGTYLRPGSIERQISSRSSQLYVGTQVSLQLRNVLEEFLDGNTRIVRSDFRFTSVSLAYFYMNSYASQGILERDGIRIQMPGYDPTSMGYLSQAIEEMGVIAEVLKDDKGKYVLDINPGDAVHLGNIIAPYVPKSLHYMFPKGTDKVEYIDLSGKLSLEYMFHYRTITLDSVERLGEGYEKWDITTSTSNFVAENVLVHNSQRSGWDWQTTRTPFYSWLAPLMKFKWLQKYVSYETSRYEFINGTRRVLKKSFSGSDGYYMTSNFRAQHENFVRERLPQGFQLYYEVVGYENENRLIMPECDNAKVSKEFVKKQGPNTRFTYGCCPGESRMFAYALTYTAPDGNRVQLNYETMARLCGEWGIPVVPELYRTEVYEDKNLLKSLADCNSDGVSTLDASHIREGVCLEVIEPGSSEVRWLKNKSTTFYILEDVIKSSDAVDLEELESY